MLVWLLASSFVRQLHVLYQLVSAGNRGGAVFAFFTSACVGWLTILAADPEFGYCLDLCHIAQPI
jgi:hypothetical protein